MSSDLEPGRGDGMNGIVFNPESAQPRIDDLVGQALAPGMSVVEPRRDAGENVEWLFSKGRGYLDGQEVHLVERLPRKGRKADDDEYLLSPPTLVLGRNPRNVLAYVQRNVVVNNDQSFSTFGSDELEVYRETERILSEIVANGRQQVETETTIRRVNRARRIHGARKFFTVVGLAGVAIWQTPDAITAVDQFMEREAVEDARERAQKNEQRNQTAIARQQRIEDFDRAHPTIRTGDLLKDGVNRAVPFTEEFDGVEVPSSEGVAASTYIRSFQLPASGKCTTLELEIPENHVVRVARTGDPREIVTATQDSVGNTVEVCDSNLHKGSEAQEKLRGQLFLQLAQR